MSDDLSKQLIDEFIVESYEGLDRYEGEILKLEDGSSDEETLNKIFRVIHTIKGTAGCLGLPKIENIAHTGENLLSLIRDGELNVSKDMITPLLELSDAIKSFLQDLETSGVEGTTRHTELVEKLEALQSISQDSEDEDDRSEEVYGLFDDDSETTSSVDEEAPASGGEEPSETATGDSELPVASRKPESSVANSSIRVAVDHLDRVMNMVGELVLARNQIVANVEQLDPTALLTASQRLNIITTELQEGVMKTRMQPIGSVWATFPRVVRDISSELGKKVRLVMDGQSTELDRTVIEAIKDPLIHIIRNSIDHGIEKPEARRQAGKPEEGLLSLRAFHEGGQVNIEIMDDGAGIDVERVKAKAIDQGMISPERVARLSEREAVNLIFLPGLSSAKKVSNVSGRGVGMDVVRTNVEKAGGSIDLQTQRGQGATIRIKIPLTLAIIPALIVTSGGNRFAIPQVSLLELVRLEGEQAKSGIEMLYGAPIHRLRGQILPLAYLKKTLRIDNNDTEETEDEVINIIVLEADGKQFGLVVDQINDTEEIVVKPLSKQLKDIKAFAGATIMGDGKVALIIDVLGYAEHANVISETSDHSIVQEENVAEGFSKERESMLIFNAGGNRRMAIPLSLAARLEEFPKDRLERAGTQEVVQYRDQIMPLIRVSEYIDCEEPSRDEDSDVLQVVVYSENGRSVGLVVDCINDIVEVAISVQRDSASQGILGSAVIQEKVTDLLDVPDVVRRADPNFYSPSAA